jgi:hypothetical protein
MNSARIGSHPPCQGQSHTTGVVLLSPASASLLLPYAYHNRKIGSLEEEGTELYSISAPAFFTCMGYKSSFSAIIFHDAAHQLILFPGRRVVTFFLENKKG